MKNGTMLRLHLKIVLCLDSDLVFNTLTKYTSTSTYTSNLAPQALATYNLLPIFSKFVSLAGVDIVPCDISLSGRVLAAFPEYLQQDQLVPNNLAYLGDLCQTPDPIIIKLPNISASVPQLEACIQELRSKGYNVPLYPNEPKDDVEREVKKRYAKVLGSAVNPVLRQGNSDRHASAAVKRDAQKNPIKEMAHWAPASKCHVANMEQGDFYGTEQSAVISNKTSVAIEMIDESGKVTVLKDEIQLSQGELIDGSYMDAEELCNFFERQVHRACNTTSCVMRWSLLHDSDTPSDIYMLFRFSMSQRNAGCQGKGYFAQLAPQEHHDEG